jgi:glycosyltransferase involved in cell wall biosynthesis
VHVAVYHHMPPGGGAMVVLAEVLRRSRHRFTIYTRYPASGDPLVRLDERIPVRRGPMPEPRGELGRLLLLARLPRLARGTAAAINAGGHDAVLCWPSELTQAPEVLPYLEPPSLYFAPEHLRSAYDPQPAFGAARAGPKERLTRWGLNPYERRRRQLDRRHIRAADRVVTLSRYAAGRLEEIYGVRADIVDLGVDAATFSPPPAGTAREGYVLSVGALHPLKGHQLVVEAVATLPPPRPPVIVVGDRGDAGALIAGLGARLGVEVEVRRGIRLPELVSLYHRASALACAQIGEPFGLIALEAMAACTPVVAVRDGGFRETVEDGVTGLLVERDARELGAALRRVIADPDLARELGAHGRERVLSRWTWEATARQFDDLLDEVAARG